MMRLLAVIVGAAKLAAGDQSFCCWSPAPPAADVCKNCKHKDYKQPKSSCSGGTWCSAEPTPVPPTPPAPSPSPPPPPSPSPPPPPSPKPPTPPSPSPPCTLKDSGPVSVTQDGQVVEWLSITTTSLTPGILVEGKKDVIIRNVKIQHNAQTTWPFGTGIYFTSAPNLTIYNVEVNLVGVDSGPLPDLHNYNIFGSGSSAPQISNVRVSGGSSGIELSDCDGGIVSNFVASNVRGPYPRGQCFQASQSDNIVIQDFYCRNDNTSWTEDSISIWRSSNSTVRRGLVDGNDSPSGVGVMIEQDDMSKSGALVEDVDAVRMGDGCFSAYGGRNIRFVRTRCRENHCNGWANRKDPMSEGLLYAAGDENGCNCTNISIEQSQYFAACNPDKLVWEAHEGAWTNKDLTEVDFTLRTPVSVQFCWDTAASETIVV